MDDPPWLRFRLSLLMFLQYAVPGAFLPLLTLHLKELRFTPLEMGVVCATQALAALVATWVAGQVADRWVSAERCLTVCSLLAGFFLWLLAGLTTPAAVAAACLGFWLAMVPATTLGTSLCFTHLANPEREFGQVRLWGTVGWVASLFLLAGWFRNPAWLAALVRPERPTSELADIFRVGAGLAVLLSLYSATLPHTPPARQAPGRLAPLVALGLLRQRSFAIYAVCTLGVTMTLAFTSQVTPLLLDALGIPLPLLTPTLTLSQSSEIVSLALLPVLLLRLGMRGTMRLGLGAWLVALAILTLGQPRWLVVASLALNGLCICGYLIAGQVFFNSQARGDIRASAQGLFTFVAGVGLLAGHLLVGVVRQIVLDAYGQASPPGGALMQEVFAPTLGVATLLMAGLFIVFLVGFPADEQLEPLENNLDSAAARNEEVAPRNK